MAETPEKIVADSLLAEARELCARAGGALCQGAENQPDLREAEVTLNRAIGLIRILEASGQWPDAGMT